MATTPPALGYGQRGEAPIDSVNQWMRGQPWYQSLLQSFGQNPNNVHLSDNQKQAVIRAAQANGVVVDEGHNGQEVDDSGNFQAKSHALRNTLIVGGLAAATLLTAGGAGAAWGIGPAWGAAGGAGAAAGGGAAALGPSTAANLAATAGIAGGSAVPAGLAAGAAGGGTLGTLAGLGKFIASPGGSTLTSTLGGVFSNIYGANKSADAARYGVDAQTAATKYAADLQDEAAKRAEAFSRQQAETGWQSGEQTQHNNYDQWAARQRAVASLGQTLGINYSLPDYVPGIDPHYLEAAAAAPGAAPPAAPTSGGGDAAKLKALLDGGMDPQQAVQQFNKQYARSTGNEAVYYDPSQHGGVATVGLPDAYLAKPGASWDITTRAPAAAAPMKGPATLGSVVAPRYATLQPWAMPTTYQPGTLGAYLGRG